MIDMVNQRAISRFDNLVVHLYNLILFLSNSGTSASIKGSPMLDSMPFVFAQLVVIFGDARNSKEKAKVGLCLVLFIVAVVREEAIMADNLSRLTKAMKWEKAN